MFQRRLSDTEYVEGIRKGNPKVIESFDAQFFKWTRKYVCETGGSKEDAKDIWQNGFMILFEKVCSSEFELSGKLKNFIFIICRNNWIKSRDERDRFKLKGVDKADYETLTRSDVDEEEFEKEVSLISKCFDKLDTQCKLILKWRINGIPYDTIATSLNLKNNVVAIKKKRKCKEKLMRLILKEKNI